MALDLCKLLGMVCVLGLTVGLRAEPVKPAEGKAAEKCPGQPSGGELLAFRLKKPVRHHGRAAAAILRKRFPCLTLLCTSEGEMLAEISRADARRLLGKHAVFRTVRGAGNVAGRDAHFADIEPVRFVPASLRAHVERLEFLDDPKYPYTATDATPCE